MIRKCTVISLDGGIETRYEILGVKDRLRVETMLTLNKEELIEYAKVINSYVEKEPHGEMRQTVKSKGIQENDIYVNVTFDCKGSDVSERRYNLSLYGNYELSNLSADEVQIIINALADALKQEGGEQ